MRVAPWMNPLREKKGCLLLFVVVGAFVMASSSMCFAAAFED
jgi:hypothetical protein